MACRRAVSENEAHIHVKPSTLYYIVAVDRRRQARLPHFKRDIVERCLLMPIVHASGKVEVLNRHVVDLPERVAGLPKELESRESPIPYDYDLSVKDPQDRVCTNGHAEILSYRSRSLANAPPRSLLPRRLMLEPSSRRLRFICTSPSIRTLNRSIRSHIPPDNR